jgi:hypothetical protein
MATVSVPLSVLGAEFFSTVQAPELLLELNTATAAQASPVYSLAFDTTTQEAAYWTIPVFNYGSGNVSLLIDWFATAVTGGVVWGGALQAQTPGDAQSVLTDALVPLIASQTTVTTTASATASGPTRSTLVLTSLDSLAAGDIVTFKLYRDPANASDTMAGDAKVRALTLQYSDV